MQVFILSRSKRFSLFQDYLFQHISVFHVDFSMVKVAKGKENTHEYLKYQSASAINQKKYSQFEYWIIVYGQCCLTLFPLGGGGLFDPLYHESVCRIYRTRTRFTKIHDFVPFGICQDPVKPLLRFFSKKFKIFDVEIFWGSSSIRKISKKLKNFFLKKTQNLKSLWSKGLTHEI